MACVGATGKMPSLSQVDNFNGTTEWTRSCPSLQEGGCSLLTPFPWAPATLILNAARDRQSLAGAFFEVRKCLLTGFLVGGIIGLGTCKEKVFTKESANPFVHIPMMSGNSMPHFSKVHYIPALYLLGKCYLICR